MSLMLCHHCFTWVEPLGDQCPQCDYPLDARSPDPSSEQLNASIGPIVGRMGEVRISRFDLPGQGTLYETTQGLFFVPHRLEQVKLVRGDSAPRPFRSMLAAWLARRSTCFAANRTADRRRGWKWPSIRRDCSAPRIAANWPGS